MFQKIFNRYNDTKTKRGHEIKVSERGSKITIWFVNGAEIGEHKHIGIAQITKNKNLIEIGWFEKDEHDPYTSSSFEKLEDAFTKIDERINSY